MIAAHAIAAPILHPIAIVRADLRSPARAPGNSSGFLGLGAEPAPAEVAPAEADLLAAAATTLEIRKDGVIFCEGDAPAQIHEVVRGLVRLHKLLPDGRRQIVGFLEAGDYLGLTFSGTFLFSAEAVTETVVRRIPCARFNAVLDAHPALQRRLLAMATTELVAAQDQMLLLGRKTAQEKLCSFLLMVSRRRARRGLAPEILRLPMPRGDIADYLGLTMETVSRVMTQLKTKGIIRLRDEHRVELTDLAALAGLATARAPEPARTACWMRPPGADLSRVKLAPDRAGHRCGFQGGRWRRGPGSRGQRLHRQAPGQDRARS
jgi:CRP/FNR family transcriptional regulator